MMMINIFTPRESTRSPYRGYREVATISSDVFGKVRFFVFVFIFVFLFVIFVCILTGRKLYEFIFNKGETSLFVFVSGQVE